MMFKNPYSQFLRLETDFTKTWSIGMESSLVGHVNAGVVWCYGNSDEAPFSEQFYVGGANSIRAFLVRDIGPGSFTDLGFKDQQSKQLFYLMRNGDLKLVANLEYRTPLFGNLKGAVFLDAGNVWRLREYDIGTKEEWEAAGTFIDDEGIEHSGEEAYYSMKEWTDGMTFRASRFFQDIALGTGFGLRYDLGFLVIRLDWGIALHLPCDNGVSGYFFNVERFKDLHTLNFAIGYPF
jgi:outer membrane protein assembly factor BamA